jgi:hypothetical protein
MKRIRRPGRSTIRTGAALLLSIAALITATVLSSAPAHARSATAKPGADVHATDSKQFTITNLSGYRIQLNAASGSWEGRPGDGTWVLPGQQQSFELKWTLLGTSHGIVRYYKYSDDGLWQGDYWIDLNLDRTKSASSDCRSTMGTCTAGSTNTALMDDKDTVVTLGGGQAQAQAQALDRLCRDLPQVSCAFAATKEEKTMIPAHVVGLVYANSTLDPMSKRITISEKVERSQSVEVSTTVEASVLKLVQASVTAKYGQVWTNSLTFEESSDAVIRAGYKVWSEMEEPTLRFTGDFTMKVGNTTFRLVGVHFDVPDPKPTVDRSPTLHTRTAPLSGADGNLPPVQSIPTVIRSTRAA